MTFQTADLGSDAFKVLRSNMPGWKVQAQTVLTFSASSPIDSAYVFRILDQLNYIIATIQTQIAVSGLAAYAADVGYSGDIVVDSGAVITAAQNCVSWVTTNFPKDAAGFAQAYTLNANGTRTSASFTPAQAAGFRDALAAFVATIQ